MTTKLTIIGAGPGGYVAALHAARHGAEVTLVERETVGGTCLNRGCIPSKIMKTAADLLNDRHRTLEYGTAPADRAEDRLDLARLLARKQKVVEDQAREILRMLKQTKVAYLEGTGLVTGPGRAEVRSATGTAPVAWDKLILATGSRPATLPGLAFDGQRIISSTEALNLEKLPKAMAIVGGGVIGCEFAFIFSAFGVEVTLIEALDRLLPLPSIDDDCVKVIAREMKKRGIKFYVGRAVEEASEFEGRVRVRIGASPLVPAPKKPVDAVTIDVDQVLVCVGRRPETEGLGLGTLGVEMVKGWIKADSTLATNVPDVWAIGDALGPARPMLAHLASVEGRLAVDNCLGRNLAMNYDVVPSAIFTRPEMGAVGLTVQQAAQVGWTVKTASMLFRQVGKAQAMGEVDGLAKIVADADSGRVLGVHIVGPHATDLMAEGALAIRLGATVKDLAETIHAHPTLAEGLWEAALSMV